MKAVVLALAMAAGVVAAGCSEDSSTRGALAARGRQIYLSQCVVCHNPDPGQAGPIGPPLRGSSPALLEAKLLRGAYPAGYTPKRPTSLMPLQPALAGDVPALAAFLN